jgi:hypothetical protein
MWWLGISTALAGSGPWTVGASRSSVFLGVEGQRLGHLAIDRGDARQVLDVGEGLQRVTVKGIATLGLSNRVDFELGVPWSRAEATRADAPLCVALGLGACETTQGIGVVDARGKLLLLDEYFNAPISLAVGGEVRLGQLTADDRERITNLGEGTLDAGPFVSVGRTAGLGGSGYLSAWVQGGYRFRSRNTDEYPLLDPKQDVRAPRDEVVAGTEVLVSPSGRWAVGPQANLLYRPGLDFSELDLADVDRFAALGVTSVRVGGTVVVRASDTFSGALSVLGTAVAVNNPTDTWIVSTGVQWNGDLPGADR